MRLHRVLLALAFLGLAAVVRAEDAALSRLFDEAGVKGTLLIESLATGRRVVHDTARARQAFSPASSFKVLHTLIALEEGVIAGADDLIPWDGKKYEIANWNRDQNLRSAFRVSCVWCYQDLARRVGAAKYPARLREAAYGELKEPFNPVEFWLDGSLTISAEQQLAFLRRLLERRLPYRASSYETLKAIMLTEETPDYRLYPKTGWGGRTTPGIGWYIGYAETAGDTWLFVLNIDTRDAKDLPWRQRLAMSALRQVLGLK